jgi:D-serine deaminase-like pyridoxal phosphate-dependent protein
MSTGDYQAMVGRHRDEIDTPALLIDLDALERNISRMGAFFAGVHANLRPHSKTHKCPQIARLQIEAGARGITCAKVGEAEALVDGGIDDILIANQIVGPIKIARLVALAARARMTVAVDDPTNVAALGAAATAAGVTLGVLVEVNVGMDRCGVEPGEPALALSRIVRETKGLQYRGLMGYEGHTVMIPARADREAACLRAMRQLLETKDYVEAAGLPVEVVSGGGSGTYDITGRLPGMTEIQAGSYATMDAKYASVGLDFEQALTLTATVISRPTPDRAVLDCGLKAMTSEFGLPVLKGLPGASLTKLSEEHSTVQVEGVDLRPGQRVEIGRR